MWVKSEHLLGIVLHAECVVGICSQNCFRTITGDQGRAFIDANAESITSHLPRLMILVCLEKRESLEFKYRVRQTDI